MTTGPPLNDSQETWNLFYRYSSDLSRVTPELHGKFRCPLCLELFQPIEGTSLRTLLAPDHIVPEALGGRLTTLSCRRCNNTAGSALERHLIQRVRIENGQVPIKARIEIEDSEHGAEVFIPKNPRAPDNAILIKGVGKRSDPRQIEKAKQAMMSNPSPTIRMRGSFGYVHQRSQVALVRSAHLMMFRTFGYEYLNDSCTAPIFEQLKSPRSVMPIVNGIMWRIPDPPITETCISVLVAPPEIRCFFVILSLLRAPFHLAGVVIPPPGSTDVTLFERLRAVDASSAEFKAFEVVSGFIPFRRAWDIVIASSGQ